MFRTKIYTGC